MKHHANQRTVQRKLPQPEPSNSIRTPRKNPTRPKEESTTHPNTTSAHNHLSLPLSTAISTSSMPAPPLLSQHQNQAPLSTQCIDHNLLMTFLNRGAKQWDGALTYYYAVENVINESMSPSQLISRERLFIEQKEYLLQNNLLIYVQFFLMLSKLRPTQYLYERLPLYMEELEKINRAQDSTMYSILYLGKIYCNLYRNYKDISEPMKYKLLSLIGGFFDSPFCTYQMIEIVAEKYQQTEFTECLIQQFNATSSMVNCWYLVQTEKMNTAHLVQMLSMRLLGYSIEELNLNQGTIKDFFKNALQSLKTNRMIKQGLEKFVQSLNKTVSTYYTILDDFVPTAVEVYPECLLALNASQHVVCLVVKLAQLCPRSFTILLSKLSVRECLLGVSLDAILRCFDELESSRLIDVCTNLAAANYQALLGEVVNKFGTQEQFGLLDEVDRLMSKYTW